MIGCLFIVIIGYVSIHYFIMLVNEKEEMNRIEDSIDFTKEEVIHTSQQGCE
jgi:hypothetical protein